jgi:hypothetical protein
LILRLCSRIPARLLLRSCNCSYLSPEAVIYDQNFIHRVGKLSKL